MAQPMSAPPVLHNKQKEDTPPKTVEVTKSAPTTVKSAQPATTTPAFTPAPEKAKPQDKSRPVSSTPVVGTPW